MVFLVSVMNKWFGFSSKTKVYRFSTYPVLNINPKPCIWTVSDPTVIYHELNMIIYLSTPNWHHYSMVHVCSWHVPEFKYCTLLIWNKDYWTFVLPSGHVLWTIFPFNHKTLDRRQPRYIRVHVVENFNPWDLRRP